MRSLWFHLPDGGIAIDDGWLPRERVEEFGQLTELIDALRRRLEAQDELRKEREAEATRVADQIRSQARQEAEDIVAAGRAQAQRIAEQARQQAYEAGLVDAMTAWQARRLEAALEDRIRLDGHREAIARIACDAVSRLVAVEAPRALYEKAMSEVGDLMKGTASAVLRVHPERVEDARQVVSRLASQRDAGFCCEVVGDLSLGLGGCVFESDLGTVDASLEVQLEALRRAFGEAVASMPAQGAGHTPQPLPAAAAEMLE